MRPNILFIMTDQFRADAMGCVGGYTRTPNLDWLAQEGLHFTNAFANSAECIPSRISLASGLYPHQTGVDRNSLCTLNPDRPNWMQAIAEAGYQTGLFGKTHLHSIYGDLRDALPLMHRYGFEVVDETTGPRAAASVRSNMTELWERHNVWDAYREDFRDRFATKAFIARPSPLPLELYYDSYVGRAASRYLESVATHQPWFCWVSFSGPHEPWDAPEPYASMYRPQDMPPPKPRTAHVAHQKGLLGYVLKSETYSPENLSLDDVAAMRANYAGNVSLIDDEIGRILRVVRQRNEMDRTVVVFTSDHGEMNGDYGLIYKANFLDPAIKIPLIVVPPAADGIVQQEAPELVELMDVGATLVDYAGAKPLQSSHAISLRPRLDGRRPLQRQSAICEFGGNTCVITERFKVEFDADLTPVLAFDRAGDSDERYDISQSPDHQGNMNEIKTLLTDFRRKTPANSNAIMDGLA